MKYIIRYAGVVALYCFCCWSARAQSSYGIEEYRPEARDYMSDSQREAIQAQVQINRKLLQAEGRLSLKKTGSTTFEWPMKANARFPYCNYWGISNFVDHDLSFPNKVLDYNCGSRTYDLSNGYNHDGTDIFLYPFPHYLQEQSCIEAIAAAPGILIYKVDGYPDQNCDFSNQNGNGVIVEHSDGVRSVYWHLKKGSVTGKKIGDAIALGETVGYVASSGASTGPHLHFGVTDSLGKTLDPFTGPCNAGASMWAVQPLYYSPTVNAVLTHSTPPVLHNCPNLDTMNLKDTFIKGESFYLVTYFRDQIPGDTLFMSLTEPDNTIDTLPPFVATIHYNLAWYWLTVWYGTNDKPGTWKITARLKGTVCEHDIIFADPTSTSPAKGPPDHLFTITPNPATGIFRMESDRTEDAVLYNILGEKIMPLKTNGYYDVSKLPRGIYVVGSDRQTAKLVLQER
jgi:hypothetical protein